jgi:hypothetical protein
MYPSDQFIPSREYRYINNKDYKAFLRMELGVSNIEDLINKTVSVNYERVIFVMQDIIVKIDQKVFNTLMDIINSITRELDFYYQKPEHFLVTDENNYADPCQFDPNLTTSNDLSIDISQVTDEFYMVSVSHLQIKSINISITLRIDISSIDISMVPGIIVKILGTVGNAIARISDSPLFYKEIDENHIFMDYKKIIDTIKNSYISQSLFQIYKIIGSSDLLGNPVGLMDKIGTGVTELVSEPLKSANQGPSEFGKGMARGLNSLFSNVVGGGFDTVGKITGSLLSATKYILCKIEICKAKSMSS